MKKHLQIIRVEDRTEEWFQHRNNYIGSSEAGAIMGQSDYTPSIKVFDEKIGRFIPERFDNKFTFWGKMLEDIIAQVWQYYKGLEEDDYIYYQSINQIQRKNKRINGIVINPKYPWLSANLDRVINKGQFRLDDYSKLTESECPLEIKEIDQFAASKWESGVPMQYILQVVHQCIILEVDYGEICLKQTNRKLNVIPIVLSDTLKEAYLEKSRAFMESVEKARIIYSEMKEAEESMEMSRHQELEAQLVELEPSVEESDAYVQYLKERYRGEEEVILGNEETFKWVKQYDMANKLLKLVESKKTGAKAHLQHFMRNNQVLDNGKDVTCTWREGKKNRTFLAKYKGEYTVDEISEMLAEIKEQAEAKL